MKPSSGIEAKSPTAPMQTTFGCPHIKGLLTIARQQATDGYTRLIQSLRKEDDVSDRTYLVSGVGAKTTTTTPTTTTCTTYLCLQCPTVSSTRQRHRKDHVFAVESDNGFIYCHDCHDFVYDPTFEDLRTTLTTTTSTFHAPPNRKRKLSALSPPTSTEPTRSLLRANAAPTPCAATGLRGMYNMGQTCFMSVILQSLLHNPLLRTWFLSEGHKSSDCEREACTACALDDIFTDFWALDKHEGYGAVHMLQGCWKAPGGGGLAGYSQQDAHEYWGFVLNSLHGAITEEEGVGGEEEGGERRKRGRGKAECDCVIHRTFSGRLRSTVTCLTCQNVTTSLDPFMDLSLDIRSTAVVVKKKKLSMINGTTTVKETLPMDLTECLDRFTSPETLGSGGGGSGKYFCRQCDGEQEARKQLGLERLPPVLPVHFKRFECSKGLGGVSRKVETRVRVPLVLDLAPYLVGAGDGSKSAKNTRAQRRRKTGDVDDEEADTDVDADADADAEPAEGAPNGHDDADDDADDVVPSQPIYNLASVIVHKGKIDNGHYISYCRQAAAGGFAGAGSGAGLDGGEVVASGWGVGGDDGGGGDWFRFDDSMVVQVSEREVLGAEAYMVFYVARGWEVV
ncbi:hypothetical protein LTR57_023826 [Friedmanniomyces endolithicus]|uniref:Ubiquitin carboxyl-terminal hydrolase n=3 Tax=Friedmanniomyces endolithicus TaxID=329885 RepID=A0AAN6FKG5_9PEZI|nr:hypothetical protein LTS00_015474 [Friedmanniomyces endolithicus]KAK0290141.1 hypothetical protein LTR35_002083 [Friedmanniomyces endolithicus]KAK0319351.1 hypothetical protein LTR82_009768 [Friedmanniomyces endolithicus]KAK0893776.1 hypothetical protein LTR57_023826 [Friedmanniomyces endolithicus]